MKSYLGPEVLDAEHAEIEGVLIRNGMPRLFHFTSIENLPTIFRIGAILSKRELERRRIIHQVELGGNLTSRQRDEYYGNDQYVSMSYRPKLPMAYYSEQEQHICYMAISRRVALGEGVKFTDVNAAHHQARRVSGLAGINMVDFSIVKKDYVSRASGELGKKQAEILVPTSIPSEAIEYVAFRSQASLDEGTRLCLNLDHPPFSVHKGYFNFGQQHMFGCHTAALVSGVPRADGSDIEQLGRRPSISSFSVALADSISLVSNIHVTPGLMLIVVWNGPGMNFEDIGVGDTEEPFYFAGDVWVWSTLSTHRLVRGQWTVTIYLIARQCTARQLTIPFSVT